MIRYYQYLILKMQITVEISFSGDQLTTEIKLESTSLKLISPVIKIVLSPRYNLDSSVLARQLTPILHFSFKRSFL